MDRTTFACNDENNLTVKSYSPNTLLPYYPKKKIAFTQPSRTTSDSESRVNVDVESSLQTRALVFNARRSFKKVAFTLAEVFSPSLKVHRKIAFTLAEVLITLGVIGVVAAITMPQLIKNYQIHHLRAAFMKANTVIQEALKQNAIDYGYTSHAEFIKSYGKNEALQADWAEIEQNIIKHLKVSSPKKQQIYANWDKDVYTFWGDYMTKYYWFTTGTGYILPGGMAINITGVSYAGGPARMAVKVDTNGPNKGPNRYGYDIFDIGYQGITPFGCNPFSGGSYDLFDCSLYAAANINPMGKGDYWNDFLWKSKEELKKMKDGK